MQACCIASASSTGKRLEAPRPQRRRVLFSPEDELPAVSSRQAAAWSPLRRTRGAGLATSSRRSRQAAHVVEVEQLTRPRRRLPVEFAEAIRRARSRRPRSQLHVAGRFAAIGRPNATGPSPKLIVLPLAGQKSTLAVLGIKRGPSALPFNADDRTLAEALASRAAMALENASLVQGSRTGRPSEERVSLDAGSRVKKPVGPHSAVTVAVDVLRLKGNGHPEIEWSTRDHQSPDQTFWCGSVDDRCSTSRESPEGKFVSISKS